MVGVVGLHGVCACAKIEVGLSLPHMWYMKIMVAIPSPKSCVMVNRLLGTFGALVSA